MDIIKANALLKLKQITTDQFTCEDIKSLDNYFFTNDKFLDEFSCAIGGLEHHSYVGGLLDHTLNVVYLTKILCEKYNAQNKEIAILSAKLHDIGKIYEYNFSEQPQVTLRGEMEGHIVIGITMLEKAFDDMNGCYSDEFKNRIKGCIVQHHGELVYGSPKMPNSQEAFILHYADYLDATMTKIADITSKMEKNQWSPFYERIGNKLYK